MHSSDSDHEETIKITHVKMMHRAIDKGYWSFITNKSKSTNSFFSSSETKQQIAASQFAVAKHILNHPEAIVVHEGIYQMVLASKVNLNDDNVQAVRQHFDRDTFNKDFDDLSKKQKKLLQKNHGAFILLYLNLLDTIYPAVSLETNKSVNEELKQMGDDYDQLPNISASNQFARECDGIRFSLYNAQQANVKHVLLIYGGNHNFISAADHLQDGTFELTDPVDCSNIHIKTICEKFAEGMSQSTEESENINKIDKDRNNTSISPLWNKTNLNQHINKVSKFYASTDKDEGKKNEKKKDINWKITK